MNFTEETAQFGCDGESLIGILAKPELPSPIGVVLIVGGPQYRVGSHRQFVLLSRALAAAGYSVLRFDYRGMGDSSGAQRDFDGVSIDIEAAIDALQKRLPGVKQVALWGLCDAASAALLYWDETRDPRLSGLCLLNPWVRSDASLARTQVKHYYLQRLQQREFWLKLVSGGIAAQALRGLLQNLRAAFGDSTASTTNGADGSVTSSLQSTAPTEPFQHRMAQAWKQFPGKILLILSGDDYTAKEFQEYAGSNAKWEKYMAYANLTCCEVAGVNHTFSSASSRKKAEAITLDWLRGDPEQEPVSLQLAM